MEDIGKYTSILGIDDQTIDRFTLQAAARELTDSNALRACLRVPVANALTVDIMRRAGDERVYYRNLCTCKRVWICPVCAARISERRTQSLLALLTQTDESMRHDVDGGLVLVKSLKYHVAMATFTIGHKLKTPLSKSMSILKESYHRMWSGRVAQKFNETHGIIGSVRAFEITTTLENGWHPHIHLLLVSHTKFTLELCTEMYLRLGHKWIREVDKSGGYATIQRGVNVTQGNDALIKYIDNAGQKIARVSMDKTPVYEVGKTPAKTAHEGGRTLWQLLADYVRGDVNAGILWAIAQSQLRGTKQLLASNSLKALLQDPDSLNDEVAGIIDVRPEDICLAKLDLNEWKLVHRWGLRGQLLEVARQKGSNGVLEFMNKLRTLSRSSTRIPS